MSLSSGTRLGNYQVVALIGAGGMGEVYRARDTRLNRDVALKVLPEVFARDTQRMARFEREAKVLAALNHPNIAAIYGLEESGPIRALVMELVEGPTLGERIRGGAIPLDEALPIARQVADAVEYAHENNVIHRDLKPANIKVKADGMVKVLDFGLAKALSDEPTEADMSNSPTLSMAATMQGVILGTAAYMAPEQAKGKKVDRRADVWAFGVVLYEMLAGKPLFTGETIPETLASVMKEAPALEKIPSDTPPAIRNLLRRCLEKNVKRRLQNAGEARIIIEDVLSGAGGASQEGLPATAAPSPIRRLAVPGLMAWGAVLTLALAALSFVHFRETPPQQASVRFEVTPPEKSTVSVFKLSPDGRYLAMLVPEGGRNRLWLRPLDSLQAELLTGTDGATYPFWSPDSAFIGFFAQDKLKKIAIAGGPAQTLCDAPGGRGGTWNRDGVILFAGLTSGIYRVPAAGGVPSSVTQLRASGAGNLQRFPEFLPDGRRFFFQQSATEAEATGLYIGSLEGMPPLRILPDASNAVNVPVAAPGRTGHLLFKRENTLMAQPFDPVRLQTTGEMFPVAEQVGIGANVSYGAFSVSDGGVLAYWSGGLGDRELVWLDRTGKRLGVIGKPGAIGQAALSPDEQSVALRVGTDAASDVWLQELARGVMSRFTFGPGSGSQPVWSPDGTRIAFRHRPGGGGAADSIYVKPASGAGKEELLKSGGLNSDVLGWSRDGKFIVYGDFAGTTNNDLWLLPLEGDHKPVPYLQTAFNDMRGQFSPDGRWMAYVSNESGHNEVYLQPIPASGAKRQISTAGGDDPRWRRDGKELFYIAADRQLMAVPVNIGGAAPGSFEIGLAQALFEIEAGGGARPYQPAADGKRFLVNVAAGGDAAVATPITVITNWQAGLRQ